MAIYRFSGTVIRRSAGQSVVGSAAYRSGDRLTDETLDRTHDYTRREGVVTSFILAPEGAPAWTQSRETLWNTVERSEKRVDAQLAREFQIALPHELTPEQRETLLRTFVQEAFVNRGMVADVAIHAPDREGDQRNHHAHVLLTMRTLTEDGFGPKERDWNSKQLLGHWRELWGERTNQALERAGHDARIDHRTLADRGIDREPEPKLGPLATKLERQGKPTYAGDDLIATWQRNAARDALREELARVKAELTGRAPEVWSREDAAAAWERGADDAIESLAREQLGAERKLNRILAERQRRAALYHDRGGMVATFTDANRLMQREDRFRSRDAPEGERLGIAADERRAAEAATQRRPEGKQQGPKESARERTSAYLAAIYQQMREERDQREPDSSSRDAMNTGRTRAR